jgi:DNA-binding NtrC family response regulator
MESAAWAAVGAGRDSIQAADIRFKQTQRAEVEVEGLGRIAGNTLEEKISLVTYHIVQEAVKAAGGNVTRAAQQLGTSRWTIQRVLGERRPGR